MSYTHTCTHVRHSAWSTSSRKRNTECRLVWRAYQALGEAEDVFKIDVCVA
jgi:hypothetical protein